MGSPSSEPEEPGSVLQGLDDPWGSGDEAEAEAESSSGVAGLTANSARGSSGAAWGQEEPAIKELGPLEQRVRRVEELVLQRWATARDRGDEILQYSSMITCMPLPRGDVAELPRGYSAAWGLEVRREAGSWRVLAAGRGFRPGDVVERCGLLPLQRPEDDDAAICRFLSFWDPEAEWTKEHGEKLPELRARKLEEMQLHRTEVLRLNRMVRLDASTVHYPLGYAHLYADAESGAEAAAELRVGDAKAKEAVIVALREIFPGEEITLSRKPPVKSSAAPEAPQPPAEAVTMSGATASPERAPCSGYIVAGPSGLHGRGTFASADYAAGRAVELCPALVLDGPAALHCADYAMSFGGNCGTCSVLPLGCGALYNHARSSGAAAPLAWAFDEELDLVILRADTAVSVGSELVIDYGVDYWGSRGLDPAM